MGALLPQGKRAPVAGSTDEALMTRLGEVIQGMKEDFMVVHFREPCSFCRKYLSDEPRCPPFRTGHASQLSTAPSLTRAPCWHVPHSGKEASLPLCDTDSSSLTHLCLVEMLVCHPCVSSLPVQVLPPVAAHAHGEAGAQLRGHQPGDARLELQVGAADVALSAVPGVLLGRV